ncbi:MAG TPA: FtsX-like permease family protein [Dehalococcoidia bacterium]
MTEFLGVSTTLIMFALLALLGLCVVAIAFVAVRNRILFTIGLRNIPRRRTQSLLIVIGLMLSTAIVSAALSTGDTVEYSITNETYNRLGQVDELVQVQDTDDSSSLNDEAIAPAGILPRAVSQELFSVYNGDDRIDGILPGLRLPVPAQNHTTEQPIPEAVFIGLDTTALAGFENDIVLSDGTPFDLTTLRDDEAVVSESAAAAMGLALNSRVDVFIDRLPRTLHVAGVVQDKFITGWTKGDPRGVVVPLETMHRYLNSRNDARRDITGFGFVAISNRGGVRDSLPLTGDVSSSLDETFRQTPVIEVARIKRDRVDRANEIGSNLAAIFIVLGVFTIAAGLLLVFLILVMLATERRTEMGISRAVGMKRRQLIESFMAEGIAYSGIAAAAGALLGVAVSFAMARVMSYIFSAFDVAIAFHVTPKSVVIAFCLGVVLTFAGVVLSAWRVSNLTIVTAIREINEPAPRATGRVSLIAGIAFVAVGIAATVTGLAVELAYAFGGGLSLVIVGIALLARWRGVPERAVFTATSIAVLVLWFLVAGETLRGITGPLDDGIETFFIGGVLMVAAATMLVVYNAELLLGAVRSFGVVFVRATPAVRTAVAYPLASKFRTGMTIAMMSLVVFALVMISTLSLNFRNLFLDESSRGGWDITVDENPTNVFTEANGNTLGVFGEALDRAFYNTRKVDSIGRALVANPRTTRVAEVNADGKALPAKSFLVLGADSAFLEQNTIGLQARAEGFATDRDAWLAVRDDPSNAIIDGSVVPGINYANVTESRFTLKNFESGTTEFRPFDMQIIDTTSSTPYTVHIVGIMDRGPSETYSGLYVNDKALDTTLGALYSRYYVRLKPGNDASAEADGMELKLAAEGISADAIKDRVADDQRLNTAFFYLVQGFMALGLGVGLAALGVIAFRTVVERRQHIGLMRAIGYTRTNIALTFMLESAFIAILGIANGTWLALLLANRILQSDQFSAAGFEGFDVPWLQIGAMALLVFVASVLTTIIPSRQASSIPIAEALRYE